MKRYILFSLLILVLLAPLTAKTEGVDKDLDAPPPVSAEAPALTGEGEDDALLASKDLASEEEGEDALLPTGEEEAPSKAEVRIPAGNTTVSGVNGYIVLPSAEPAPSKGGISMATGYSAMFSSNVYAHIPFVQMGFSDAAEVSLAVDMATTTNLLLNAKWRFSHRNETSLAVGVVGQFLDVAAAKELAGQLYFASTFSSSIMDFSSKTTVLLGYTFHKNLNTNIDFGIAFQTPLFPNAFKEKVYFLLDFGNVSYSLNPSAGDALDRGLVNIGIRLAPVKVIKSVYLTADVRALDLFDHKGRAVSVGVSLSFKPT